MRYVFLGQFDLSLIAFIIKEDLGKEQYDHMTSEMPFRERLDGFCSLTFAGTTNLG